MSENGHDIQVCLCKTLKLLSQTCVAFTLKHPVLFVSTICVFLLYVAFPFAFWILVYSVPLVVCTAILVLSLNTGRPTDEGEVGRNSEHSQAKNSIKRPITRVHSVRRRRAKEFARDEGKDKTDISTTVSPKDIREVEVVLVRGSKSNSLWDSQSSKHEFDDLEEGKEVAGDDEKNKMDVVISDSETTKRLESLIARRRLRKLLSLEVRRSQMNKDRNQDCSFFAAMPKINNMSRLVIPSCRGGPRSPVPGSTPSVLTQMRNPFDLPYDPQEEKPDLTGDSCFEQEFMSENHCREDMTRMFCRHESFNLRPFLPGEFNRSLKEISSSSVPDEDEEDQIKEIIQVHEKSSSEDEETENKNGIIETTAEARRRHVTSDSVASDMQVEVSELSSPPLTIDENLSYVYNDDDNDDADSWTGNDYESRLAHQCDHPWCSIASCRSTNIDEMIDETLQRSEESSTLDAIVTTVETRIDQGRLSQSVVEEGISLSEEDSGERSHVEERVEANQGEGTSNIELPSDELTAETAALEVDGQSSPSPKSVLHPTCSLASFDNIDDEVR